MANIPNSSGETSTSSFFAALNAPFVQIPSSSSSNSEAPRIPPLVVPRDQEPLLAPIFTATGDWEWLNDKIVYDIHEVTTVRGSFLHRVCIFGELTQFRNRSICNDTQNLQSGRSLIYVHKQIVSLVSSTPFICLSFCSWKLATRHPGIMSEVCPSQLWSYSTMLTILSLVMAV